METINQLPGTFVCSDKLFANVMRMLVWPTLITRKSVRNCRARGHLLPEVNLHNYFIERLWSGVKWWFRDNCEYNLAGLWKILPIALRSVTLASINRYYKHCE